MWMNIVRPALELSQKKKKEYGLKAGDQLLWCSTCLTCMRDPGFHPNNTEKQKHKN